MGTFEDSGACKGSVSNFVFFFLCPSSRAPTDARDCIPSLFFWYDDEISRFAFVDFTSIEHATEALVNPRNHRLNGRNLVVEYASPDAVRRGGGPRKPKGDHDQKSGASQKGPANASYTKQRRPRHTEQEEDANVAAIPAEGTTTPRSRRPDRAGHDRPHTRRAKPGAALAHAQRQSAAIVPGQGQKIVF